ncbi:response regulator transcription factor [Oceanirhabdus sp. W0125-5]|uniref:response regulator transcription factor n=1 Tax=Oceanirhabdus sp. W0125-5 TaxID=2999116 RepID=UPI0022F34005|nr:response regulator transcription factor [Oceanirhabdus sp. W0125-5]WBW97196.1 response regulator transcription factor [Oceanirhabdus sp. W0125-5]
MENKILLVEDDKSINEMVKNHIEKEGFVVETAFDGEEAINKFLKETYDLIILDLMLPKLNGMEFMRLAREKSLIPIIIMSAKDSDVDKAIALGMGADDYISKPFSLIELLARVKASIRRANTYSKSQNNESKKIIELGELNVDLDNYSVTKKGELIKLTAKEFEILKLFIKNPKRVFTKEQLYNLIWNDSYLGEESVINVHIQRLRKKIEDNPSSPKYIKTLWGIGYKLGEV